MSQFTFGTFTGEIDTQDYAFQAKMEDRYQELSESIAKIPKDGKRSDYILHYCRSVFTFFNALFGEGTDRKMFGESTNMRRLRRCGVRAFPCHYQRFGGLQKLFYPAKRISRAFPQGLRGRQATPYQAKKRS